MLPASGLNAPFLFEETQKIMECVKGAGGNKISILCDNKHVHKVFVVSFDNVNHKSWLTKDVVFLLFDFVHIIKSIMYNWITENSGNWVS